MLSVRQMLLVTSLLAAVTIADPGLVGAAVQNPAVPQPRQKHMVFYDGPAVTVGPDSKSPRKFHVESKDGTVYSKVVHFSIRELNRAWSPFRLEISMKDTPKSTTKRVTVHESVDDITFDTAHVVDCLPSADYDSARSPATCMHRLTTSAFMQASLLSYVRCRSGSLKTAEASMKCLGL